MADVVDPTTGVRFPLRQTFWNAAQCRSLGVGPRLKRVAFIDFKVYSITLYVDEDAAKTDLNKAQQAGKLGSDQEVCAALTLGSYTKVFQLQLVRSVTGAQFSQAFDESLGPRMKDDRAPLEALKAVFSRKHLDDGTNVVLMWRQPGSLEVLSCPPGAPREDFSQARPEAVIDSRHLCQALWENYLDPSTPAPKARQQWIQGAQQLLGGGSSSRGSPPGDGGMAQALSLQHPPLKAAL